MNAVPPLTLPIRLRIAREHAGMSIQDMARALGVGRNTVPRWEGGSHTPPLGMVKQWAAETGVSLGYLMGEEAVESIPAQLERRRNPQRREQRRSGSHVVTHLDTGGRTDVATGGKRDRVAHMFLVAA